MQDNKDTIPLSDGDEAVCAYFIENPIALRRVVQLMPHANPTLDFLQKLYSFAVIRNRKVDLANALLGYDAKSREMPQIDLGCDWFRGCDLPGKSPLFFFEVGKYDWTRVGLKSGEVDDDDLDSIEAQLEGLENLKKEIGEGIVDLESTMTKVKLKRNAIRKVVQKHESLNEEE